VIRHISKYVDEPPRWWWRFLYWQGDGAVYAHVLIAWALKAPLKGARSAGRVVSLAVDYWDVVRQWYEDGRYE